MHLRSEIEPGSEGGVSRQLRLSLRAFAGVCLTLLAACAPLQQGALQLGRASDASFSENWFTSFDGAQLGLNVWRPDAPVSNAFGPDADAAEEDTLTETVIIAIHGMNDYAAAFNAAGAWWREQGATVYAYDQRGFGRSPRSGIWPEHEVMRRDLKTAVKVARQLHPDARIAVVGESMGASVAITAFAEGDAPKVDALILSGPGLRGWSALPWYYSLSLWASAHVRPDWVVGPPKDVRITPTDNNEKLREMWFDPLVQKNNRIDSVYGVVSIMDEADARISKLPRSIPTLLLYGARDEVIPPLGVQRAAKKLPRHVKTAYYADGYHMLMNDLQARTVWADVLAFIDDPKAPLPSRAPPLPWVKANAGKTPAKR
jgi:alpha-beta hydrolase superfamily lysophospholipase